METLAQTHLPAGGQAWIGRIKVHNSYTRKITVPIAYFRKVAPPDPVAISGRGGQAGKGIIRNSLFI